MKGGEIMVGSSDNSTGVASGWGSCAWNRM